MYRAALCLVAASTMTTSVSARPRKQTVAPTAFVDEISSQARANGVPETLVHRVVLRESRYNPRLVSRGHYGLMQISYATARSMGYNGAPSGLLDPATNLSVAVPYLANAYRTAGGSETQAVALYSRGYYYIAKRRGLLGEMRTANSPALGTLPQAAAVPQAEPSPFERLIHALSPGAAAGD